MSDETLNFENIHEIYRPKIRRYLARMVGEYEAEDLTQVVFLKVHRALPGFKGESKLSTWIYRIAANTALDTMRSPSFRQCESCRPPEEAGAESGEPEEQNGWTETETSSPENLLFHKQRYDCYLDVLETLPLNYRAIIVLSEIGELAVDEIARILGLTPGAVKIRLHRGRDRLLKELKAHCRAEDWL
jgi:RNA polymerase sigma-70 factor (ECF subfamily)